MASFLQNLNFKIQMLAGNSLKMCIGVGFEISSTLVVFLLSTLVVHTHVSILHTHTQLLHDILVILT